MKNHVWFKGVDWGSVYKKEIPPPWVPEENGELGEHFDEYPDSNEKPHVPTPSK